MRATRRGIWRTLPNARGVEPGSEGLETGPASGAAPAGSLMGLAGAEKPRLSL